MNVWTTFSMWQLCIAWLVHHFMIVVLCTTLLRIEKQLLTYLDVEYSLFFLCWQCWGGTNRNLYFDWQHDWANQRPGNSQYTRLPIKYSSAEKLPCSNWGMTKFLIHVPQRYTACVLVLVETYHTYYSTFMLVLLHLWLYNIYLFNLI